MNFLSFLPLLQHGYLDIFDCVMLFIAVAVTLLFLLKVLEVTEVVISFFKRRGKNE